MFKKSLNLSEILLVIANCLPLFGVLFLDWDLFSILFLYWLENIVVGLYAILRILRASKPATNPVISGGRNYFGRVAFALFFLVHYGLFTVVHGTFVFVLFGQGNHPAALWLVISLGGFVVSHGISFAVNYLGHGEYTKTSPDREMSAPYKRVVTMHLTILFGGFLAMAFGAPILALVVLVTLKTGIDLFSHISEHSKTAVVRPVIKIV